MSDRDKAQFGMAAETIRKMIEEHEATLRNPPNPLFSNMELQPSGLWTPKPTADDVIASLFAMKSFQAQVPITYGSLMQAILGGAGSAAAPAEEPALPPEPAFEVDMMEPLVGWRRWRAVGPNGAVLSSINSPSVWHPLEAFEAKCRHAEHDDVPRLYCTCGIYALDREGEYDMYYVLGEVYGWGRYVRGNGGWRAQFAYPKAFHLLPEQVNYMESLKRFRVPIDVWEKNPKYDPREDGYGEYRGSNAHGSLGADRDSNSTED
jgi:hypothetical protein